jgi:protein gp37
LRHINLNGDSLDALLGEVCSKESGCICEEFPPINWVILGGESGAGARPMPSHWAFDLRDQCEAAHVPFFFKQWSEWIDCGCSAFGRREYGRPRRIRSDGTDWPNDGVPADENADVITIVPAGVKDAGAELGGRQWRAMPEVVNAA